ncbi:hypothetical protein SDC9_117441 [bioreactor metagenome]|uniref:ABC-2 family transporter protein n=1 Tax=bioreactor metagenome TaxID=1076179 RepID=A0A645BY87_9ZZZZ
MLRMIGYELLKIKSQKRNFVILAGHLLFVLMIWYLSTRQQTGNMFLRRFNSVSDFGFTDVNALFDGLFLSRLVLIPSFMLIMPIAVCTLCGDIIAGEAQDGSLKLYLARSRSRSNVFCAKFIAAYLVNLAYSIYFGLFGLLVGILVRGVNKVQLIFLVDDLYGNAMMLTSVGDALVRYGACILYFSFSLMALGAIALFFSVIFERMTTATVAAITLHFVCYAINALPIAEPIQPYLLVNMLNNASLLWMVSVPWQHLAVNLASLTGYIILFAGGGLMLFNLKDIR